MSDQSAAVNRDQRKGERITRPQSFDYLRFGLIAVFHACKRPRCNVSDGGMVALLFSPYRHNAEPIRCRLSGANIYWRTFSEEVESRHSLVAKVRQTVRELGGEIFCQKPMPTGPAETISCRMDRSRSLVIWNQILRRLFHSGFSDGLQDFCDRTVAIPDKSRHLTVPAFRIG